MQLCQFAKGCHCHCQDPPNVTQHIVIPPFLFLQVEEKKVSNKVKAKLKDRNQKRSLDQHLDDQFATGRLYACISSRPGQCGRCDGYILEGKELEFYQRRLARKKGKGAVAGIV